MREITLQPFIVLYLETIIVCVVRPDRGSGCRVPDLHGYIAVMLERSQAVCCLWFRVQPLPDVGVAASAMHLDTWWWRW